MKLWVNHSHGEILPLPNGNSGHYAYLLSLRAYVQSRRIFWSKAWCFKIYLMVWQPTRLGYHLIDLIREWQPLGRPLGLIVGSTSETQCTSWKTTTDLQITLESLNYSKVQVEDPPLDFTGRRRFKATSTRYVCFAPRDQKTMIKSLFGSPNRTEDGGGDYWWIHRAWVSSSGLGWARLTGQRKILHRVPHLLGGQCMSRYTWKL